MGRAGFLVSLLALTIFRVWYSGLFELSLDEPYYWLWSLHPQMGYYDHPPMVAWLIAVFTSLADSERFVRLAAALLASGATWFAYETARGIFNDKRAGLGAALLINIVPITSVGAVIITPDSPLMFFWLGSVYYGHKLIDTQEPRHWYATGFFYGLALLSKYTAALFAPALFLFILYSAENRHWLFRREPYMAFALSIIIFSPVIYWNHTHDWTSFRFQFSHGFSEAGAPAWMNFAEFWGGQVGLFGVAGFFLALWTGVGMAKMGLREKRDDFLYISFMTLPLLLFFTVNSFKARMEGNWAVVAYLAALTAAPGFVQRYAGSFAQIRKGRLVEKGYAAALVLMAVFTVYIHAQIVDPALPMPQKRELSRRIYGWSVLGNQAAKELSTLGEGAFVLTQRYQISSLMAYYTPGRPEAFMMTGKGRFGYLGPVEKLIGRNAVYLEETERIELDKIRGGFERVEPAGVVRIERDGELIREFSIYRCYNYQGGLVEI
ncbi:MAG: glycosyltransferase family 39 protein [Nitrospinae bacterium]|nr:glycosyltransferase family 39 protein [Nitrospinota bacterium]